MHNPINILEEIKLTKFQFVKVITIVALMIHIFSCNNSSTINYKIPNPELDAIKKKNIKCQVVNHYKIDSLGNYNLSPFPDSLYYNFENNTITHQGYGYSETKYDDIGFEIHFLKISDITNRFAYKYDFKDKFKVKQIYYELSRTNDTISTLKGDNFYFNNSGFLRLIESDMDKTEYFYNSKQQLIKIFNSGPFTRAISNDTNCTREFYYNNDELILEHYYQGDELISTTKMRNGLPDSTIKTDKKWISVHKYYY